MTEAKQRSGCDNSAVEPGISCDTADHCVSRCAGYGKVCPCNARAAGRAAKKKMEALLLQSTLFAGGKPNFRTISHTEVVMGDRLGEGGFAVVKACSLKEAPLDESLAIKSLKRRVMVERSCFEHGAADLITEAFFLAKLDHANIVKLHGITEGNVEKNISSGQEYGFFIVLDRLVETLEQRIERWKRQSLEVPTSLFYRMSKDYKEKRRERLKERLQVSLDISMVVQYLHDQNILFRDLKPDNIGFDSKSVLKLFDFGLAKEEKLTDAVIDEKYRMTAHTGSQRYMAPEVATDKPYNKAVDIYSLGILLWEICTLEKPFVGYSSRKHMRDVIIGGERPAMDSSRTAFWPLPLQWLLKNAWSPKPENRPTIDVVCLTLEGVLKELGMSTFDQIQVQSDGGRYYSKRSTKDTMPRRKQIRNRKMMGIISR